MTIVQAIETSGPGGAEQVLVRLCCHLRDSGHRVLPLLLRSGWLTERLEAEGFNVALLPLRAPIEPGYARRLRAFLRESGADVLHSHEITFAAYGRVAAAGAGIAHVATAHGRNFTAGWKRRGFGALLLRSRGRFRLAAVSGDLADEMARAFFLDRSDIAVVENGVDLPVERPVLRREPGDPLRIVVVGNLYPVKNHGVLIRALALLRQAGVSAEMDILGRGREEETLRALIRELGLDQRVRLPGFRPDVPDFLSRAHVFASSSLSEAMPLSFLEAMGQRLPVIASRVGGVPALVEDGIHGLLFDSGDAAGAARALARIATDEELRLRLGAAAALRARERFSAASMVRSYADLYGRLIEGAHS